MSDTTLQGVVRHLRTAASPRSAPAPTDRQLLLAFASADGQSAFADLVERHGPMVLRVCRRVLRHAEDAEDAFQATFLVLARKARSIHRADALASWLHGVAYRVALRAKRDAGRRRAHEREVQPVSARSSSQADWREVQAALDEEVQALPDMLRGPFVLCFLEGRSRAEAAAELGLKEGTVWSRLSRARRRLQQRLAGRGVTLSALLAGAALAEGAVPARLRHAAVQAVAGAAPARVAALAEGVSKALSISPAKAVFLGLVAAGLAAVASVTAGASARPAGPSGTAPPPRPQPQRAAPPAALEESGERVTFPARVVGPNGKPVPGAEVTLWCHFGYEGYYRDWHPTTSAPLVPRRLARSGADGRLSAAFRKAEVTECPMGMWERPWRLVQVVAAAKGYGPAWAPVQRAGGGELTLRLAKEAPTTGRVRDLEGRPLAGATVRVVRLTAGQDTHGSLWQGSWAGLSTNVTTGRDGRFSVSGLGRDRTVLLSIAGPRTEHRLVAAGTAAAAPVEVLVGPTKPVEGTVTEKGTGKPLAGVVVYGAEAAHHRLVRAVTDARGRYRLVGLAKAGEYALTFYPPLSSGCLGTIRRVPDSAGLAAVTADVALRRGVELRCRFIDKKTRQPVRGVLHYTPLRQNALYAEAEEARGYIPTREFRRVHVPGPDGVCRLVVYPGLGLLVGNLQANAARYARGRVAPADAARTKGDLHMEFAGLLGVYRLIEPKDGGGPLTVDIELEPKT